MVFFLKLFLVHKTYPLLNNLQLLGPFVVIFGPVLANFLVHGKHKKTNSVSYQALRTCRTLFLNFCGWMMDGSMCQVTGDEEDEKMVEEEAENGFK